MLPHKQVFEPTPKRVDLLREVYGCSTVLAARLNTRRYVLSVFLQFLCNSGCVDHCEGAENRTHKQTTINPFQDEHLDLSVLLSSFL